MNTARNSSRQFFLALLVLLVASWASGEGAQWLLRWRAEKLLADVRSIHVDRSQWADAQRMMQQWNRWGAPVEGCTAEKCDYRINLVQSLPPILGASPQGGVRNLLPRLANLVGLRSTAARAGFTVENGVITSRWFGEQVTPPVADSMPTTEYIPYLSVLSEESAKFRLPTEGHPRLHPNRTAQPVNNYLVVGFTPDEDPSEKAALLDFHLSCITQLLPCHSESEILPEGWKLSQER
ncbi:MAG: hypothetical protein P4K80_04635 [Acidobacteriaceae bacterium]|nr:hypothetical protein [Acidobacteriaceae bacterium]